MKRGRKKNSCMSFTARYFHLLQSPFSSIKSFHPSSSLLAISRTPSALKYSVVVHKKHLIIASRRESRMKCHLLFHRRIITATGTDNVCFFGFDSQVMGVCCVHRAIVAAGWLPSGAGTKNKESFFPPFTRPVS